MSSAVKIGTVTLKLQQPIERRSKATGEVVDSIAELHLRPMKMGDLVAAMDAAGAVAASAPGTLTLHLAARCAGVSPHDLEELGIADGFAVFEAVQGFMPAGLKTGTSGSGSSPGASASPRTGGSGDQPSSSSGVPGPDGGNSGA